MENFFFKKYYGRFIIKKAGHWVQQEQPHKTFDLIIKFLKKL
jgi:pimeloyl-ACP methyl ester carboxylesterase